MPEHERPRALRGSSNVNLPNLITLSRLILTIACFACLELVADPLRPAATLGWTACALFVIAAATDFLDGWFARAWGQVTQLGRVADPFVDKILICGVFIVLLRFPRVLEVMPSWFVVVVVAREFLVTTLRGLAEGSGIPFPADRLGKWKMVAQCILAGALLTMVAGTDLFRPLAVVLLWVTLALTVVSGAAYTWKARGLLFAAT